ncbi:MAG: hypothetical protein OXC37_04995 [Bdellovibrionaceae bacterium]|nr:hypothetical protein [Pseudobdellovibrionaceae bacterium]
MSQILRNFFINSFIFFCTSLFLFPEFSISSSFCRNVFEKKPGDLIIDYVRKNEVNYNISGFTKEWEEETLNSFKKWTEKEVNEFLDYLTNRIGIINTVKSLSDPSYFQLSSYKKFKSVVSYYDSYIAAYYDSYMVGVGAVTRILSKSMRGFFIQSSLEDLKELVKFIESYIGENGVIAMIQDDFGRFTNLKLFHLKEVEKKWGKKKLKETLLKNPNKIFMFSN